LLLLEPRGDPPSVRVPLLVGAGPGSVVPDGCVPSPVVGAPLVVGASPLDAGGSSTPPPATGPLGPVDPVPPVAPVAPVPDVGSAGSSTTGGFAESSITVDCGAAVVARLGDLSEDLSEDDLCEDDEDGSGLEAEDELDALSLLGAAGSGAGADSGAGAGAGASMARVETAAVAPEPSTAPVSSPEANAGTVAGITSNMQKVRIVAIFDR
jgi:hypothetical protein